MGCWHELPIGWLPYYLFPTDKPAARVHHDSTEIRCKRYYYSNELPYDGALAAEVVREELGEIYLEKLSAALEAWWVTQRSLLTHVPSSEEIKFQDSEAGVALKFQRSGGRQHGLVES